MKNYIPNLDSFLNESKVDEYRVDTPKEVNKLTFLLAKGEVEKAKKYFNNLSDKIKDWIAAFEPNHIEFMFGESKDEHVVLTFEAYVESITEAKGLNYADGWYVGDKVYLPKYGTGVIKKIEMWGKSPTYFFGRLSLGPKAFTDAELLEPGYHRTKEETKEEEKARKREEAQIRKKAAITSRKYDKVIKDWVSGLEDTEDIDMYSMIHDTVDNFMITEPEYVEFIRRRMAREGEWDTSDDAVKQQIGWDMEAAA